MYQFVHLEAYARKPDKSGRSVSWVLDEAARVPGAAVHVPYPNPPIVLHGVDVEEVRRLHDQACEGATVTLATGKSRALRKDQKTILTVVASHPTTMDEARTDPAKAADVKAWEARAVAWLKARYGVFLVSVIRHTDEAHPHIHAYVIPSDLRAMNLHPGAAAKRQVVEAGLREGEDTKALNKRGDAAYRAAMRGWQDSYWESVGLPSGQTRLGPGRRRLTREEWRAEKTAATSVKLALDRAGRIRAKADQVKAAAIAQAREAQKRHDAAVAAETRARGLLARARAEADKLKSLGGLIRTIFDGLRRSRIEDAARREAAMAIEQEKARVKEIAYRASEESRKRQEAERRAREAVASAHTAGAALNRARQELATLRPPDSPHDAATLEMRR